MKKNLIQKIVLWSLSCNLGPILKKATSAISLFLIILSFLITPHSVSAANNGTPTASAVQATKEPKPVYLRIKNAPSVDKHLAHGAANQKIIITGHGIDYHGGPLIIKPVTIYYIYYGGWSTLNPGALPILDNLARNIGGSPYYAINTTYYDRTNHYVVNKVKYGGSTIDNYSLGKALSDQDVKKVVKNALHSGQFPANSDAVYFVLTSNDVQETSGFGTSYCAWHSNANIAGNDIKYAFVGDPSISFPDACEEQEQVSPNNNLGADAMASMVAHELEESVTDPHLDAWWDSAKGDENADKCAWTFGTQYTVTNGSLANMKLGGLNYLIQQNWVNAGNGYCDLSLQDE